jgi:tripartite-type tricarboxylate transporter receptor subunit TctC
VRVDLRRRRLLRIAAGALLLPAIIARAAAYPTRPVRIVLGFAAGITPDIAARIIAGRLSQRLGQPFIVENRTGAAGNIATEIVARARADGHTLLLVTIANTVNATLYGSLGFDFLRDIVPVAAIVRTPLVTAVNPAVPATTVGEFIAYAKSNPGKINMASAGKGTPQHVAGELFKMMAGVDLVHVPYSGNVLPDVISGQVQVVFNPIASSIPLIREGRLRALGVTSAARVAALPDVPPVAESLPGYEASSWYGIGAPRETPTEIVERLNREINAALADPAIAQQFAQLGAEPMPMTPAAFGKFLADETRKWSRVVTVANIKAD